MKILFVIPDLLMGGIEVLALRLSEAFGKAGHEVILYVFHPEYRQEGLLDHYDTKTFRIAGVHEQKVADWMSWKVNAVLRKAGAKHGFRPQFVSRHFSRLLKNERPDVICPLSFHQDYEACKHAAPLGIPVVISMHGIYESVGPEWPERGRFIYEHVRAIIYAADKNMSWFKSQPFFTGKVPAVKIYTGTDLQAPIPQTVTRAGLGIPEDAFVYIMVARGIKEKGWREAIEAFGQVYAIHPHTRLLLVGEGAYLDRLKEEYRGQAGILFYGNHPNSVEVTVLANAGLLPSYFSAETMPNVIVDYLRCGLPVIASDIGEIVPMLTLQDKRIAGNIVARKGQDMGVPVDELSSAMVAMAADRAYYGALRSAAEEAARKFDIRDCLARYIQVFEYAASGKNEEMTIN